MGDIAERVAQVSPAPARPDRPAERASGPPDLLALQSLAGNQAVSGLLANQVAPYPNVPVTGAALGPNDLVEKQNRFRDAGGEQLVTRLKAALAGWQSFRANPTTGDFKKVPGFTEVADALRAYVVKTPQGELAGDFWPEQWMRTYASAQLGQDGLLCLSEMASLDPVFPRSKASGLFSVTPKTVSHYYELTAKAETVVEKGESSLVPLVTINYQNSLGWHWTAKYLLVGAMIGVSVSVGTGVSTAETDEEKTDRHSDQILENPEPWWWPFGGGDPFKQPLKPNLKPKLQKPKPEGKAGVGPLQIALAATGAATNSPYFWGPADVAGTCTYAEVGGVSFKSPIAQGSASFDALLNFSEDWAPEPLSFTLTAVPKWEAKPKATGMLGFSLKGPAVGLADAVMQGDATFKQPELAKPAVVDDQRTWYWQAGPFDTGSADASGLFSKLAPLINQVRGDLDPGVSAQDLIAAGIDPQRNFDLQIEVVGYASRRWSAAGSDAERLERNEQLAIHRAANVLAILEDQWKDFNVTGVAGADEVGHDRGGPAAVILVDKLDEHGNPTGDQRPVMAKDAEAEAYFRRRRDELDGQLRAHQIDKDAYDAEMDHLIASVSRTSNADQARKVEIKVSWSGRRLQLGDAPAPASP